MLGDEAGSDLFQGMGLDLAAILAPLAAGDGGGEDIRYTPEFDRVAAARQEEDDSSQGIWKTEAKKADWPSVVRMGADLLATRSKDLQIAVWMTEALVVLHGLRGAAAGFELLARLSTGFWPTLWPRPEDGDLEPRLGPYFWLDTRLGPTLTRLAIAEKTDNFPAGVTYHQLVKARRLQQLAGNNPRAYQESLAEGEMPIEQVTRALGASSDSFFEEQAAGARQALAALAELAQALEEPVGREAPSFAELRRALGELDRVFTQELKGRGRVTAPEATPRPEEPAARPHRGHHESSKRESERMDSAPNELPAVTSRRAAYALLGHAADWLLRHEPHSPVPYLVRRALSWEDKSLRDVLAELMARGADREVIFEMLGMEGDGPAAAGPRARRP